MVRLTQAQYDDLTSAESAHSGLSPSLRYVVGIDPGATTGLAVWDRERECFDRVVSTDFWGAVSIVREYQPGRCGVVIEDPDQKEVTVYRRLRGATGGKAHRIAANIGSNRREARLLIERFESWGYDVMAVEPTGSKWNREYCKRITGYDGTPNNQDVRDSIKLCYQQ